MKYLKKSKLYSFVKDLYPNIEPIKYTKYGFSHGDEWLNFGLNDPTAEGRFSLFVCPSFGKVYLEYITRKEYETLDYPGFKTVLHTERISSYFISDVFGGNE
ncbi:hypothetical protein IJ472_06730 [bacterium]|nr:hypothetical protein [bacterium]